MKPIVNEDACTGCWTCDHACPEVFQVGQDGKAHVINDNPDEELLPDILRARNRCDYGAISIKGLKKDEDKS